MYNSSLTKQLWLGVGLCEISTDEVKYLFTVSLIVICSISSTGNALVLSTLSNNKVLRTPTAILILLTATIDFLLGSTVIPLALWILWNWNDALNTLHLSWLFAALVLLSLSTLLLFIVYRFFNVYQFGKHRLSAKKTPIIVFICWLPPLLITTVGSLGIALLADEVFIAVYYIVCSALVVMIDVWTVLLLRKKASNVDANKQLRNTQYIRRHVWTLMVRALFMIAPVVTLIMESLELRLDMFCVLSSLLLLGNAALNPLIHCLRFPAIGKSVFSQLSCLRRLTDPNKTDADEDSVSVDECFQI